MIEEVSAGEVRASGVLMEANRVFFHPLGLEMFTEDGFFKLRELGATMARYAPGLLETDAAREKSDAVEERRRRAAALRRAIFGWSVQEVGGRREAVPLDFVWSESALDALLEVAGDEGQTIVAVLSQCWLLPGGAIDFVAAEATEEEDVGRWGLSAFQAGRLSWLARNLPQIGAEKLMDDGKPRPISGALYDGERVEVEQLAAEVWSWEDGYDDAKEFAPGRPKEILTRLEDLYGLAQPGMRFFRGDKDALDAWEVARPAIEIEMARYLEGRPELEKFLQGDITADQLTDRDAIAAELYERLEPLDEQEAMAAEELEAVRRASAPARAALDRLRGGEPGAMLPPNNLIDNREWEPEPAPDLDWDEVLDEEGDISWQANDDSLRGAYEQLKKAFEQVRRERDEAREKLREVKQGAIDCEDASDFILGLQEMDVP